MLPKTIVVSPLVPFWSLSFRVLPLVQSSPESLMSCSNSLHRLQVWSSQVFSQVKGTPNHLSIIVSFQTSPPDFCAFLFGYFLSHIEKYSLLPLPSFNHLFLDYHFLSVTPNLWKSYSALVTGMSFLLSSKTWVSLSITHPASAVKLFPDRSFSQWALTHYSE